MIGIICKSVDLSRIASDDFTNFLNDDLGFINDNIIVLDDNFTRLLSLSKTSAAIDREKIFIRSRPPLRIVSITTILTL